MTKKEAKKRIENLKEQINKYNELYYNKAFSEVSDYVYDNLLQELKDLEKQYPEYKTKDSPTNKVGTSVINKSSFFKVKHLKSMLSLESVYKENNIIHFDETCKKIIESNINYMCEAKLDGISIELVYEKGIFKRAVTRGNGTIGEDVTNNVKTIKNIPKKLLINNSPEILSIRGEIVMHIKDFHLLNKKQILLGKESFANPRNVVSGTVRQLDVNLIKERKLYCYCYDILYSSDHNCSTQEKSLLYLKSLGFQINPKVKKCSNILETIEFHKHLSTIRDNLDYEIDGIVIKVNNIIYQKKLGERTNNPKWAIAYKFEPRKEITKVEDIIFQVGRTGVITPLALLQSVDIGGVTVSRATLHNMDQIKKLNIKIGDYVKIARAGDVIPYISEVIKEKRTGKEKQVKMLVNCPSCNTLIIKEDVFFRCPGGLLCPAQLKESINHYVSKDAANIIGFSKKTTEILYEKQLIKGISDIYLLKKDDFLGIEGWKDKKINNLLQAIDKSKNISFARFLYGLGIKNVGKHIAYILAKKFNTINNIFITKKNDLLEIKEIGEEIADNIILFFQDKKNIEQIKQIQQNGVTIQKEIENLQGKWYNKKIVFTGTLKTMTRTEAKKIVETEGGIIGSSISNDIDFLVIGENPGSKLSKAKQKNIKILTEQEFKEHQSNF